MRWSGILFIVGPLILALVMIVAGAVIGGGVGHGMLALGIIVTIAMVAFGLWLMDAMNTDL